MEQITTGTAAESAAQSAKLAQAANESILSELRALRADLAEMKASADRTLDATGRILSLTSKWDGDAIPAARSPLKQGD